MMSFVAKLMCKPTVQGSLQKTYVSCSLSYDSETSFKHTWICETSVLMIQMQFFCVMTWTTVKVRFCLGLAKKCLRLDHNVNFI